MLVEMPLGTFPVALGVIYDIPRRRSSVPWSRRTPASKGKTPTCRNWSQGPDLAGREGTAPHLGDWPSASACRKAKPFSIDHR
jgi:hypothetical protein